ncbi:MAG: T9SS type A sorting domain-containing protein [Bacteroidetes bacterium]|nr:T9SS type A sorting domain-containing protein [Bacteroidota bacterium]HET6244878.1 T9SS type A sorting domain-containing protein [Bacteroidia bacterium]
MDQVYFREPHRLNVNSLRTSNGDQDTKAVSTEKGTITKGHSTVKLVPNPASTQLTVFVDSHENHTVTEVAVFDLFGKKVLSLNGNFENPATIQLDLSDLPSGVYYCMLIDGNRVVGREKLLISK